MGKNKLAKFAEMKTFGCVFEYPFARLKEEKGFPLRGKWHEEYFHNDNPIVLELGCGKGEYTIGLAVANPGCNYIGIDIKGARIWKGAKMAENQGMANVAFLRTSIELLSEFFAPEEVDEIWITFPDPQMQKTRKRLISSRFLNYYRQVQKPFGRINLKTDSPFLYEFSHRLVHENSFAVNVESDDIYGEGISDVSTAIKTFYEQQWLARGKKIKLLSFNLPHEGEINDPDESGIERDNYHSVARRTNFDKQEL